MHPSVRALLLSEIPDVEDRAHVRVKAGWTQQQVAEEMGVSAAVVSYWERGMGDPGDRYLQKCVDWWREMRDEFARNGWVWPGEEDERTRGWDVEHVDDDDEIERLKGAITKRKDYAVEDFYTQASERKGQSESVSLRMPTETITMVNKLVASGIVPVYATQQDFYRDAAIHRLQWLRGMYHLPEDLRESIRRAVQRGRINALLQEAAEMDGIVEGVEEMVRLVNGGAGERLRLTALREVDGLLGENGDGVGLDEPYRGRVEELRKKLL